jgi:tripartite-type tricarboxylate transporter receptor subunit TctC
MSSAIFSFASARATKLKSGLIFVAGLLIASGPLLAAEDYPNRPIRLVVGFSAGGTADVAGRILAKILTTSLGKPVVVENKPGAGSLLGINDVLSRPRSGYDLLLCTYFDPVNTLLYKKAPYALSDIAPISLIAKYDYVLVATPSVPADNLDQLIQYAKAHPNELNYAHLGIGSAQNLLSKRLQKLTGIKMTAVSYKSAGDSVRAVLAGEVQLSFSPAITVMPFYESKQIKVLAVTGPERLAAIPEIPTLKESGIPFVAYGWLGFCAGSGTPPQIIQYLNEKVVEAVNSSEYQSFVRKSGSIPVSSTPSEFQEVIQESVNQAAPIIEEFGLKVD